MNKITIQKIKAQLKLVSLKNAGKKRKKKQKIGEKKVI